MKTRLVYLCCLLCLFVSSSGLLAQAIPVSLSVNVSAPGNRVNEDFVGFSFEGKTMTTEGGGGSTVASFWEATPTALTRFRNLLTNLSSHSVIRIGANSGDQLAWTSGNRGTNTSVSKLFNSDIDKLFNFLSTVNWKCLYMVNFAKDSTNYVGNAPAEAASEANYVYSTYGSLLKNVSIGNEPMAYVVNKYRNPYTPSLYIANYLPVYDAIKAANPAIPISGGDIGRRTEYNTWNSAYLQTMNNMPSTSPARPVDTFNAHAYPFRSNELTGTTEQSVDALINSLSPGSTFLTNLDYLKTLTGTYNTPFWMSETNSVAGSLAGVTNSFASAIWALDYLYTLATYNVKGANFHSGGNSLSYAPLYRVSSANGTYAIGSIYYGLLAFTDGARNRRLLTVTPTNSPTNPRASYYATTSDDGQTLTMTLINKDFTNPINASINIPGITIGTVSYQTLRPKTDKYDVAANTFYANAQVATDGSFTKATPTPVTPATPTSFSVVLAPMTAVIATITLQSPPLAGRGSNMVPNPGGTSAVSVPASTFTNVTSSSVASPATLTSLRITGFPTNTTSLSINGTVYTASSTAFSGATPAGVVVPVDGSGAPVVGIWVDPANDASPVRISYKAVSSGGLESSNTGTAELSFAGVPDLSLLLYTLPSTLYGTSTFSAVVNVIELNSVATTGLITVYIAKDPQVSLSFDASMSSIGGRAVENSLWTFDGSSSSNVYILKTSGIVEGGLRSLGLSGVLTPGSTKGVLTVSAILVGGSGGEVNLGNNSDADKIEYFQR